MTELITLAADVLASHGWSARRRPELASAGAAFDLVAENAGKRNLSAERAVAARSPERSRVR